MISTEAFIPCSAKHKSCTPAHAALVWGYRAERARQEQALAESQETYGHEGDRKLHLARGGQPLITFKEWLKASKKPVADKVSPARIGRAPLVEAIVAEAAAELAAMSEDDFWGAVAAPQAVSRW